MGQTWPLRVSFRANPGCSNFLPSRVTIDPIQENWPNSECVSIHFECPTIVAECNCWHSMQSIVSACSSSGVVQVAQPFQSTGPHSRMLLHRHTTGYNPNVQVEKRYWTNSPDFREECIRIFQIVQLIDIYRRSVLIQSAEDIAGVLDCYRQLLVSGLNTFY